MKIHGAKKMSLAVMSIMTLLLAGEVIQPKTAQAQKKLPPQAVAANRNMDRAAQQLARLLGTPAFRKFLAQQIQESKNKEKIVDASSLVSKAGAQKGLGLPPGVLKKLAEAVSGAKQNLSALKVRKGYAEVDIYLPVKQHRDNWRGQENALIAFAPLGSESQIKTITAYTAKGVQKKSLSSSQAPQTPTIVIAARESAQIQAGAGAPAASVRSVPSKEPEKPAPAPKRRGNTYFGIPYVELIKDKEPWYKGDPEIYALIGYSYQTSPKEHRIPLPDVNKEGTKYYIGDCRGCPLYYYFDTNYSDLTYIHFIEEDAGDLFTIKASVSYKGAKVGLDWPIKDGDDSYGYRYINKNEIPYGGYVEYRVGDIKYWVDKDY